MPPGWPAGLALLAAAQPYSLDARAQQAWEAAYRASGQLVLSAPAAKVMASVLEPRGGDCLASCAAEKRACFADPACAQRVAVAEEAHKTNFLDVGAGRVDGLFWLYGQYADKEDFGDATAGERGLFACMASSCMRPRLAFVTQGSRELFWKKASSELQATAVSVSRLGCPHTAQILASDADVETPQGVLRGGVVMPRYRTLASCGFYSGVHGGCLPQAQCHCVSQLYEQVGKALTCLHGHGYVHGDVQPKNVFVTTAAAGRCPDFVLGDFDQATTATKAQIAQEELQFRSNLALRDMGCPEAFTQYAVQAAAQVELRTHAWRQAQQLRE